MWRGQVTVRADGADGAPHAQSADGQDGSSGHAVDQCFSTLNPARCAANPKHGPNCPLSAPAGSQRIAEYVDDPILELDSAAAWVAWLETNHAQQPGIWLKLGKGSARSDLTHQSALDGALCFGWIDGQARPGKGPDHWLQRFSPRRATSRWSQVNREKAEALIAAGRMRPAGLTEVERAKADGRWAAAYASPSRATVPDDLGAALDANPAAREFFATLNSANRYAIIYRVQDAKRPETRAARIEKFLAMLAAGRRPYP